MFNLEKILNKIIKYGLYAILLTPLAFWPKALFPFLTPKFILFQIMVEIVFGAWIATQLLNNANNTNKYANDTNRESQKNKLAISGISKNYILLALLCFTAISFISALFGVDFSRSFWGIGARMTGLFAELHFLAWFLVLASSLNNANNTNKYANDANRESQKNKLAISGISNKFLDWHYYINFSFAVALVVAATAFYQNPAWGLSFGYGIFNNPTFVAPYLIFHFFWGIYKFIGFRNLYFLGGAAFLLFVILFTQIRGAVLGLLIGVFVLGAGLILINILSRRSRTILSVFYVLFIVVLVAFWQLRDNQFIQSFSPIKRVTGISLSETTVQTRLLAWQVSLKGFTDRPFFGTGPENFNVLFNAHYNPKLLKYSIGETWFDKPHNAFLQILDERGIIGFLAYALVWFAAGLALFKLFKSDQKLLSLILFSAFTAYFGAIFFSFDSFGSLFGLYLFLALLILS